MTKDADQRTGDRRDNRRVFRWGVGAIVAIVIAVVLMNGFFRRPVSQPPPASTSTPASTPQPLGAGVPR